MAVASSVPTILNRLVELIATLICEPSTAAYIDWSTYLGLNGFIAYTEHFDG
jgi:hypothetical protein